MEAEPNLPPLLWRHKLAYSLGHFYNDLCSAMWFTYLLIYFAYVTGMSHAYAGYALLIGQVVDAIFTPIIGYGMDRFNGFCGYTKRKSWHLVGTILVTLSYPFLFLPCFVGQTAPDWAKLLYFSPFLAISQIGWPCNQIAHMTLVSELTSKESVRVELNAYRNAATLLSSIIVYSVAWGLFNQSIDNQFNPNDTMKFTILVTSMIGLGIITSVIFHIFTPEIRKTKVEETVGSKVTMRWRDWLCEYQFHIIGLLYTLVRLQGNISQTFWPLYIINTLTMQKKYTSIIPMVIFISGFFASFGMKKVNKKLGRKPTYIMGAVIACGGLVWMYFLNADNSMQIFGAAILFGCGSSTLYVSVLSIITDLIGVHTANSAFVYGFMSLGDKLGSGLAFVAIQQFQPSSLLTEEVSAYMKMMVVYVVGGLILLSALIVLCMIPITIGDLTKIKNSYVVETTQQEPTDTTSTNQIAASPEYSATDDTPSTISHNVNQIQHQSSTQSQTDVGIIPSMLQFFSTQISVNSRLSTQINDEDAPVVYTPTLKTKDYSNPLNNSHLIPISDDLSFKETTSDKSVSLPCTPKLKTKGNYNSFREYHSITIPDHSLPIQSTSNKGDSLSTKPTEEAQSLSNTSGDFLAIVSNESTNKRTNSNREQNDLTHIHTASRC